LIQTHRLLFSLLLQPANTLESPSIVSQLIHTRDAKPTLSIWNSPSFKQKVTVL